MNLGMPNNMQNNFAFFQQMMQMQQMQQMIQQQQQQFYNAYIVYCQQNGLNCNDENEYNKFCQQYYNNMNNMGNNQIPNNIVGNNNINNNQNDVYIRSNNSNNNNNDPNQPKEILPRSEETIYMNPNELKGNNNQNQNNFQKFNFGALNNDIINVTLSTTAGYKVVIPASKDMTFEDLFINYAKKVGVPLDAIGTQIVFLCNGGKIDPTSKQPISTIFKHQSMGNITVLDQGNIVGA